MNTAGFFAERSARADSAAFDHLMVGRRTAADPRRGVASPRVRRAPFRRLQQFREISPDPSSHSRRHVRFHPAAQNPIGRASS